MGITAEVDRQDELDRCRNHIVLIERIQPLKQALRDLE
jgi:hypothetical protein